MIKKFIPLLALSPCICGCNKKNNKGAKCSINENDTPNPPLKARIRDLMCQYSNRWPEIFLALKNAGVEELLEGDRQILIKNALNIERDLASYPVLLAYCHHLSKSASNVHAKQNDTGFFTTKKARVKAELYDLMSNIASKIFPLNTPILLDLMSFIVMCFDDKSKQSAFFSEKYVSDFFNNHLPKFRYEDFPVVFDNNRFKLAEDPSESERILKELIWQNLIQIVKNFITPIKETDPMEEIEGIKKDRFEYTEKKYPLTNLFEVYFTEIFCKRLGIDYNSDYTQVESKSDENVIKNSCLAFTMYVFQKFDCKFGDGLECVNQCGLLSSHAPLCFLGHQVLGLVWAVINTAFTNFRIEHVNPTTELCINLSGRFNKYLSDEKVIESVKKSLFYGAGYVTLDGEKEGEWLTPINVDNTVLNGMGGYATLDHRYVINFLNYDCFDINNGNITDLNDIEKPIWQQIKQITSGPDAIELNPIFNNVTSKDGGEKGTLSNMFYFPDGKLNFAVASFAVCNSLIGNRNAGDLVFLHFNSSNDIISAVTKVASVSGSLKNLSTSISNDGGITKKWLNILGRDGKTKYEEYLSNMLQPIYEYVSSNGSSLIGNIDDDNIKNYYFQIAYRTYEVIGTFCLFDTIYPRNLIVKKINP